MPYRFLDLEHRRPLTVETYNVSLRSGSVTHIRNITDIHGRPVERANRDVAQFLDRFGAGIQSDIKFLCPDLRCSGRQNDILRVDSINDISRRDASRLEFLAIESMEITRVLPP